VESFPSELADFRASLLHNLSRPLGPEDGDEAFECHILLTVRIHRAARLNQRCSDKQFEGWRRYFADYFPDGRNSPDDADFLWEEWRVGMLKDDLPHGITHGHSEAHWLPLPGRGFVVNLESMWDDFNYSVDRLVETLDADDARRKVVLQRWRERSWTVRQIELAYQGSTRASVAASVVDPAGP
jgi:hypothetical protein